MIQLDRRIKASMASIIYDSASFASAQKKWNWVISRVTKYRQLLTPLYNNLKIFSTFYIYCIIMCKILDISSSWELSIAGYGQEKMFFLLPIAGKIQIGYTSFFDQADLSISSIMPPNHLSNLLNSRQKEILGWNFTKWPIRHQWQFSN